MNVTFKNGWFFCACAYSERELAREAGFKWNPVLTRWETDKDRVAARLLPYMDDVAKDAVMHLAVVLWSEPRVPPPPDDFYSFQRDAYRFAVTRSRAYLAADPGLGKTAVAAAAAKGWGGVTYYICPPFLAPTVEREVRRWAPGLEVVSWNDTTVPEGRHLRIIPDTRLALLDELESPDFLVVDEAHRFRGKSQRATALFSFIKNARPHRILALSGTPVPNRPIELFDIVAAMAPAVIDFKNKFEYARRYCAAKPGRFGWDFNGASNLDELNQKLTQD